MTRVPDSLSEVVASEEEGELFPRQAIAGSALVLFAGAFFGRQDAYWFHAAGCVDVTCVDIRPEGIERMARLYPDSWVFAECDAFSFARHARAAGVEWDVVSLDPPTNLFAECANLLDLWTELARRAVILGTTPAIELDDVPAGWTLVERRRRSDFRGGTEWALLERVQ